MKIQSKVPRFHSINEWINTFGCPRLYKYFLFWKIQTFVWNFCEFWLQPNRFEEWKNVSKVCRFICQSYINPLFVNKIIIFFRKSCSFPFFQFFKISARRTRFPRSSSCWQRSIHGHIFIWHPVTFWFFFAQ